MTEAEQRGIVYLFRLRKSPYEQLSLLEPAEDMAAFEYSVLVTSPSSEDVAIVQHYRNRADCENKH